MRLPNTAGKCSLISSHLPKEKARTRARPAGRKISKIEEYYLIDIGGRLRLDDKTNPQQWLKERPSNFKFPAEKDGPDLLFFLEKPGGVSGATSKILCAVQVWNCLFI